MSITNARREQIGELETRIKDAIAWIKNTEAEVQDMVDLVSNVPGYAREQMSRSASSSTKKKGKGETVDIDETVSKYQQMITDMRKAIGDKQREVDRLEKEKRDLEEYEQGI